MLVSAIQPLQQISVSDSEQFSDSFPPLGGEVKALMIWPRFPPSFWGFEGVLEMVPEKSVMRTCCGPIS
jgi:hypothetical protein